MKKQATDDTGSMFTSSTEGAVAVVRLHPDLLQNLVRLDEKQRFVDHLDTLSKDGAINVIVLMGSPEKLGRKELIEFYRTALRGATPRHCVDRLYYSIDQLILSLTDSNKMVLHADSGKLTSLNMNIALACDYRMVRDDTTFHGPYLDLGLVPKGGGVYFLTRILGHSATYEMLLSGHDFAAEEALALGIVDRVVPADEFEQVVMQRARYFAERPARSLSGIKQLMRCCKSELAASLECENRLLAAYTKSDDFKALLDKQIDLIEEHRQRYSNLPPAPQG